MRLLVEQGSPVHRADLGVAVVVVFAGVSLKESLDLTTAASTSFRFKRL